MPDPAPNILVTDERLQPRCRKHDVAMVKGPLMAVPLCPTCEPFWFESCLSCGAKRIFCSC